jgi:tripartite-type tricarboxylate transporter receptor subunit TctC
MPLNRRVFLQLSSAAGLTAASPHTALALDYPTRPVRIIVGFPAGSPSDIGARVTAEWLTRRLGQGFVIENRPGAGNNIGTEAVVRSAPDGYTLQWTVSANAINPSLYKDIPFTYLRDIAQIAGFARFPLIMVVSQSSPWRSVAEFIAHAKTNPGKINYGSSGNGSSQHLAGALFKSMVDVDLQHVPYRSSPEALNDLMADRIDVMFDVWPTSIGLIRGGKLRPLAVTTAQRHPALPDAPPVSDFVPGFESSAIQGLSAPKAVPADIIDLLNREVNAALSDPAFNARVEELGGVAMTGSAADFRKIMIHETEKWAAVISKADIKLD